MADLAAYHGRSPAQLRPEEVQAWLYHLVIERKLAWSTCNVAINAVRKFWVLILGVPREQLTVMIPRPRSGWKLPQVLSVEEVERLLKAARKPHHRTFLMTVYATGLRVGEAVELRARHIDSERGQIRVDSGKGKKDRYTLLSPGLLAELRAHWRREQLSDWLFMGRYGQGPMSVAAGQYMYKAAAQRAGIAKTGGIHLLRHSFATHLLDNGVNLAVIQRLLGHAHLHTTARYLHLSRRGQESWRSSLDLLSAQNLDVLIKR